MKKIFLDDGWKDYLYWQEQDKKTLRRINLLLQDIDRNGYTGIGNPEMLKGVDGWCSRRINEKERLIYKIDNNTILVAQCRGHYGDH